MSKCTPVFSYPMLGRGPKSEGLKKQAADMLGVLKSFDRDRLQVHTNSEWGTKAGPTRITVANNDADPFIHISVRTTHGQAIAIGDATRDDIIDLTIGCLKRFGKRDPRRTEMVRRMNAALDLAVHDAAIDGFDVEQASISTAAPWKKTSTSVDGYLHDEWTENPVQTFEWAPGYLPEAVDFEMVGSNAVTLTPTILDRNSVADHLGRRRMPGVMDAIGRMRAQVSMNAYTPFPHLKPPRR